MSETLYLGTDEIRASAGKFRTTHRYIRGVTSGTFVVAKGRTIDIQFASSGGNPFYYRYSVDGTVVDSGSSSSFAATVQDVTL